MGLLKFIERDVGTLGFGSSQYRREFKPRAHMSKLEMDDDGARYLKVGDVAQLNDDPLGTAYLAATNLIFDMLMTVYDANSRVLAAYRFTNFDPNAKKRIAALFSRSRAPKNFEVRLFGLQNGQGASSVNDVVFFAKELGADIVEIDLFGDSMRNVAIDAKRGASYDILTLDRAYKPGELHNTMTMEQFERSTFQ